MRTPGSSHAATGAWRSSLGLDGLRAVLIVLVVAGHSLIAFMNVTPGLPWPVRDRPWGWTFDLLGWWILGFTMPTFFLLAGFTLAVLVGSLTPRQLLRNRTRRVLLPFVLVGSVVLPLTYAIFSLGWYVSGRCTWKEIYQFRFHDPEITHNLWGPAHLWFLEYLYICSLAIAAGHELKRRWQRSRWHVRGLALRRARGTPAGSAVELALQLLGSALVAAAIVRATPSICTRFTNSFLPDPGGLLFVTAFMLGGMWLQRHRAAVASLARWGWLVFAAAQLFFVLAATQGMRLLRHGGQPNWFVLAGAVGGFTVLAAAGSVGLSVRWYERPLSGLRYLAEATPWIYLAHLPVVALLQIALLGAALPSPVKYLLVVGGTWVITLLGYGFLRRRQERGRRERIASA